MTDSFKQYGFTSNVTDFVCPGWASGGYTWKCQAPNACATETSTNKQYCCDAGDVCWTTSSVCATGGSTFTCTSSGSTWCCLTDKYVHTLRYLARLERRKDLASLTLVQRGLHAGSWPDEHMLELRSRYPQQHQLQCPQSGLLLLELCAAVGELL